MANVFMAQLVAQVGSWRKGKVAPGQPAQLVYAALIDFPLGGFRDEDFGKEGFQQVRPFDSLRSGEKDILALAESRHRHRSPASEPNAPPAEEEAEP